MPPPIRFFCSRCNLMMKIGAQMVGKSVVCPDCGNRIEVPLESDPQAETLYLRMKQKKHGLAVTQSVVPQTAVPQHTVPQSQVETSAILPVPKPTVSVPIRPLQAELGVSSAQQDSTSTAPQPSTSPGLNDLSNVETEQVDEWLESLWTDIPTDGSSPEGRRYRVPFKESDKPTSETVQRAPTLFEVIGRVWSVPQTRLPFVSFLTIVFLLGALSGFVIQQILTPNRHATRHSTAVDTTKDPIVVEGSLMFDTPDDRFMPDADAIVLFLPIDRIPNVPLRVKGLRVQDGVEASVNDIAQQIEELGGKAVHTDAGGKFSVTLMTPGRYLGILISSHAVLPPDFQMKPDLDQKLRRYFRDPTELLDNFRFQCEEYDLKGGTVVVQHNFSR